MSLDPDSSSSSSSSSHLSRHSRYCVDDPDDALDRGYSGIDVLLINAMHLCFFNLVNQSGRQELWWDYSASFATSCSMRNNMYSPDCAR